MNSTSEYWDVCYESGKDFRFLKHQTVTRLLKYCAQDIEHKTCLDIGCGTGQLTRELTHRGYSCTGIDVSQKAIHIARSLTVSDQLRYMCLDIEHSDLRSLRQYDLITCKYVYAFIADKPGFLRKIVRLLSSQGVLAIITPLVDDVPVQKRAIAVDFDETMKELRQVFPTVKTITEHGATCFVCVRS